MSKQMRGGPHFGRYIPETLTLPGAEALATQIRSYWSDRETPVEVWVQREDNGLAASMFCVRSTMIGGRP